MISICFMYLLRIPGISSLQNLGKIIKKLKIDNCQIRHENQGFWDGMSLRNCEKTDAK